MGGESTNEGVCLQSTAKVEAVGEQDKTNRQQVIQSQRWERENNELVTRAQPALCEGLPRTKQGPEEKDVQASSAPQEPEHNKRGIQ